MKNAEITNVVAELHSCGDCGNVFRHKRSLVKHRCGLPDQIIKGNRRPCYVAGCKRTFYHENTVILHLEQDHLLDISHQTMEFQSFCEFLLWKELEQQSKFVYFTQHVGFHTYKQFRHHYYICQHDRYSKSHGKNVKSLTKKTRKNAKDQIKLGLYCPARLFVKEDCETKRTSVRYIASHSHPLVVENTKYQPISLATQTIVKQKLSLGVPAKRILDSLRENASTRDNRSDCSTIQRDSFISLRSIKEMERKLKIGKRLDKIGLYTCFHQFTRLIINNNFSVLISVCRGHFASITCSALALFIIDRHCYLFILFLNIIFAVCHDVIKIYYIKMIQHPFRSLCRSFYKKRMIQFYYTSLRVVRLLSVLAISICFLIPMNSFSLEYRVGNSKSVFKYLLTNLFVLIQRFSLTNTTCSSSI